MFSQETRSRHAQVAAFPFTSFSSGISHSEGADQVPSRMESAPSFFSRAITITERPMFEGIWGTYETLDEMVRAVKGELEPDFSGYEDPQIIAFAQSFTRNSRTEREAAEAVFNYVARSIKYQAHPWDKQVVQDAISTIQLGYADCVSKSILCATLDASLGLWPRFVCQYTNDNELYTHVYCEVWIDGAWVAQDAVGSEHPMGWTQKLPFEGLECIEEIF